MISEVKVIMKFHHFIKKESQLDQSGQIVLTMLYRNIEGG